MATTSTTQAVWRSLGGDQSKTAYAGSMLMVADFYFSVIGAANTLVQRSSTDTRSVVLPVGAVVTDIDVNVTSAGGTSPTFDMGHRLYNSGTNSPGSLINEGVATTGKQAINWGTATVPGASLGAAMSATQMVYITGSVGTSAATSGTVAGRLYYYVPTDGAVS